MHKIIDLFSGVGGFSLGAHLAGFQTALAIDIDKDITASFNENFPFSTLLLEDISNIDPKQVLKKQGIKKAELEGIIGGPPCQGFSFIGHRDHGDERNQLVYHFFRFVEEIKPKFFIMENVLGILKGFGPKVLNTGIELVEARYNIVGPIVLNAADYGAATNRKRVFVLGFRSQFVDLITEYDLERTKSFPFTVKDAIGDLPRLYSACKANSGGYWANYNREKNKSKLSEYARKARETPIKGLAANTLRDIHSLELISGFQPTEHTTEVKLRFAKVPQGGMDPISRCPRLSWNSTCGTLRAGTAKDRGSHQSIRPIHPTENRVISVREAARLQGFPDWFQFHPTKWHSFRMIGNSVSPYIAKAILDLFAKRIG